MPARGRPEPEETEEEDTLFEEENGKDFWTMSGDFTDRHHGVHQAKLYVPDDQHCPCHSNASMT